MKEPTEVIRVFKILVSCSMLFLMLLMFSIALITRDIYSIIFTIVLGFGFVASFYKVFLKSWIASE
jgi:hypothetical protein